MIPFCLIVGDSTGLGAANALAAQGLRCEVHARIGAPSAEPLQQLRGSSPAAVALIALGSNDPGNPALARNLLAVRRRVSAARVTWLAPYDPGAARIVVALARALGDDVLPLSAFASRDRLHPASYRQVATSLGWTGIGFARSVPIGAVTLARPAAMPRPAVPIRQAVVLSF